VEKALSLTNTFFNISARIQRGTKQFKTLITWQEFKLAISGNCPFKVWVSLTLVILGEKISKSKIFPAGCNQAVGTNPSSADPIWKSPPSSTTIPYARSSIFGLEVSQMREPCTVSVLGKDDGKIFLAQLALDDLWNFYKNTLQKKTDNSIISTAEYTGQTNRLFIVIMNA